MSTPSNQWYVEMSAGITLGPMPFDAVVELAETSAVMRNDRVREETTEEWKPASDVPGLFADESLSDSGSEDSRTESGREVVSLSGFASAETSTEATAKESARFNEPVASAEPEETETTDGVVRLGGFEVLLGESETNATDADAPASALLQAVANLETVDPAEVPPKKIELESKPESDQHKESQPAFNLEIPDDAIPQLDMPGEVSTGQAQSPDEQAGIVTPPPGISQARQAESAEAEPEEVDTREETAPLDLAALMSEGIEDRTADPPPVAASAPPPFKPPVQPWRPPNNRIRKLAIRGCLGVVAAVGVWSLFSLLKPDVEAATYEQYAAIYLEYQTLTESPGSGSWSEFTTRAKAELDDTLPQLEAAAVPGERSKSLLLYAGRDLRTAIELTPGTENPHAERLAVFFEQLNELHSLVD